MQRGFPLELLELLRCPAEGGELRLLSGVIGVFVNEGAAKCARCGRLHYIRNGILSLLDSQELNPVSTTEMRIRDLRNEAILVGTREEWRSAMADALEVEPTLEAVDARPDSVVCELGCGPGRYTQTLARQSRAVVAVDFSLSGLVVLKRKLEADALVALVQADATTPCLAPRAFDRTLSTLHGNLPSRAHRTASLRQVAAALKTGGRAVISMHHYSLRDALMRAPASGHYPDSGIYRSLMRLRESQDEATPFFASLRHRFIGASLPGIPSVTISRALARLPLLRSSLSRLFLAIAERPRDELAEMTRCA